MNSAPHFRRNCPEFHCVQDDISFSWTAWAKEKLVKFDCEGPVFDKGCLVPEARFVDSNLSVTIRLAVAIADPFGDFDLLLSGSGKLYRDNCVDLAVSFG